MINPFSLSSSMNAPGVEQALTIPKVLWPVSLSFLKSNVKYGRRQLQAGELPPVLIKSFEG